MKKISILSVVIGALLLTALSYAALPIRAQAASRAASSDFKEHRAIYEIRLASTQSGSQILNISGKMLYEWQASCDAWISNHRFNIVYEYADGAPMRIDSDFSTYESFDGTALSFTSQRKRDGELFEELRGQATKPLKGAGGKAIYTLPEAQEFDLPVGALFPTQHSLSVLDKIREGTKFYNATIFDGSDFEGPVEVNAFIGQPVDPLTGVKMTSAIDKNLLSSPARRVRLAFFPLSSDEAASDYEMSMLFHENGVISDMTIEYDDFSISQKLVALESFPGTCHSARPRLNK
ncbi:MAG: cell envelope integrity EipB family protein [Alphaproteobacteria bacterium]|nr:cell envelope integrity EipB family protein [Alphaproteobacteria bacterium]